ncbi:ATP-binding protein [Streptomyces sp. NPDC002306]
MSVNFGVSPCGAGQAIAERDARQVQMARRVTAARLKLCGLECLVDDATLIVSELVTNAIVHSGGREVAVTVTVRQGFLHITVSDGVPCRFELKSAGDGAESGRGLFLVEATVKGNGGAWGTSDGGARTWCRLVLPAEQQ